MDKGRRVIVYALIYDTHDPAKREKKVISLHKSRAPAERALEKRMRKLGKRVWVREKEYRQFIREFRKGATPVVCQNCLKKQIENV